MGWVMGMGEIVKIDERWRVVIPKRFRRGLKPRDELIVERRGSDIILRKRERKDIINEFQKIKHIVGDEFKNLGAEVGKYKYRGYKELG